MKVILLTSDRHLSANIAIKTFLESPYLKKYDIQVAGIVTSSPYKGNGATWEKMLSFIKRAGWAFSLKSIFTDIWKIIGMKIGRLFIPNKNREYFEIDEMAEFYNIPLLQAGNINSEEAKSFMRKFQPDYLVSCFLLQIVDKEVLAIPSKGAVNIHPALVQRHRGIFSSFWVLLKNWRKSGATVHFMTEKIDRGMVILQRRFFVHPSDTIYCVNKKSAQLGAKLLIKALIKLKRREEKGYILKQFGQMFKMPTMEDVKKFYSLGKSVIKGKDFFKI
ncbi:MAG: formyltransferase family protein [Patescibacteria group bacterium]